MLQMVSSTTYKALRMMDLDPGDSAAQGGGTAGPRDTASLSSLMEKWRESSGVYPSDRHQVQNAGQHSLQVCMLEIFSALCGVVALGFDCSVAALTSQDQMKPYRSQRS
jgi:hypothetical protein